LFAPPVDLTDRVGIRFVKSSPDAYQAHTASGLLLSCAVFRGRFSQKLVEINLTLGQHDSDTQQHALIAERLSLTNAPKR